jgi:hypothetical protein
LRNFIAAALFLAGLTPILEARNVDLVTLPKRNTVQLTIYNSEDITLVKETRYLTFKRGTNTFQFAWANTLIDPTSIEIRPLDHTGEIEVAATIFPGQKPQHLLWYIDSSYEGQARVEVSYFTSGITWQMDYVATADPDETRMKFRGYVRVSNRSGEEYEDAEVRLIVGKINLVEKIATLARRYAQPVPPPASRAYGALRKKAARQCFGRAESACADVRSAPKSIVKEGLSEYFMFRIEGTETIKNNWSKRLLAVKVDGVKFDIQHRQRAYQYGSWPVRFFVFTNDKEHELGESPLPDGRVCIFRENRSAGLAFLGEQQVRYVPIKGKAEINLGPDKLVVYRPRKISTRRYNFAFDRYGGIIGWDEEQRWVDEFFNYSGKPIAFQLRLQYAGDVEFESEVETRVFDFRTVQTTLNIGVLKTDQYPYTIEIHHGVRAKQKRVKLR